MTATEELRRLLDERGVEWTDIDTGSRRSLITLWHGTDGIEWQFYENTKTNETRLQGRRDCPTPAQAIAATLERETCGEWRNAHSYYDPFGEDAELWCEYCDEPLEVDWGFCPYCGRRVAPDCGQKVVSA